MLALDGAGTGNAGVEGTWMAPLSWTFETESVSISDIKSLCGIREYIDSVSMMSAAASFRWRGLVYVWTRLDALLVTLRKVLEMMVEIERSATVSGSGRVGNDTKSSLAASLASLSSLSLVNSNRWASSERCRDIVRNETIGKGKRRLIDDDLYVQLGYGGTDG